MVYVVCILFKLPMVEDYNSTKFLFAKLVIWTLLWQVYAFLATLAVGLASAMPQISIPAQAKDGGYAPDHYFQYINVPKHKHYEWGYRKGNDKHHREEYLSQKDHTFKAKVSYVI